MTISLMRSPEVDRRLGLADELEPRADHERVMLPPEDSVAITCGPSVLMMRSNGAGGAQVHYDGRGLDVYLRVDDVVELRDGALIGAGKRWFRYQAGAHSHRPRLQLLDADGYSRVMAALPRGVFTVGRCVGDLVLPGEHELAAMHLQIVTRDDRAFLRNLGEPGQTWLMVGPGDVVPADGTLLAGDRLLQLQGPAPSYGRAPYPAPEADDLEVLEPADVISLVGG